MSEFLKYLEGCEAYHLLDGGALSISDSNADRLYVAVNPAELNLSVSARNSAARLIVICNSDEPQGEIKISIKSGARLNMVELMQNFSSSELIVDQSADSAFNSTTVQLSSSSIVYGVNLEGKGAECEVNILQLPSAKDSVKCDLRISHLSPNGTSHSMSKCIASGEAVGEFHGLVYVAQGAQQTLSEQSSRNIALSDQARIIAEPQLEIYADDVKCTHGATVGQMDRDAILYMRQRGLSEEQARKVQLEGFATEVTNMCAIDEIREQLAGLVRERLYEL